MVLFMGWRSRTGSCMYVQEEYMLVLVILG